MHKLRDSYKPMFQELKITSLPFVLFFESVLTVHRQPDTFMKNEEVHVHNTGTSKRDTCPSVQSFSAGPVDLSANNQTI